jgi:hypothetical protein
MRNFIIYTLLSLLLIRCSNSYDGELIFVEPNINDDFKYPYFLFIPNSVSKDEMVYLIIEPNNSGFADDEFQKHIKKAKRTAINNYRIGNYIAQNLNYPLIVPVFPRPKTEWRIYTHAMDRDVMQQKDNPLERIDKQLINMFKDAQSKLENKYIKTQDQFLLTGFSASGTFANRFTLIHPDRVFAVAAGGLNGLLMLPTDSLNNEILKYPIGVGDLKELTSKEFQKKLFLNTPQFYFMGELDENDAIPYDDAFDQNEREQIFRLLGEQMQPERWDMCRKIYMNSNVNAIIKTYDNIGHAHPEEIKKEIAEFFKECINEN